LLRCITFQCNIIVVVAAAAAAENDLFDSKITDSVAGLFSQLY